MSLHFEKIKIKEVKKETSHCVSIAFDIPPTLVGRFAFKAGQYLTLRALINGAEVRRSYSLCSSPLEDEWRVAVKKVEGGMFSTYANEMLKAGDTLELMPPMGNFHTEINPLNSKHYIGIAAGSGITPVISIIKTVLQAEPNSRFTLVYGNRNRHSIIFKDALEAIKNKYLSRFNIIHILSREITDATINHGRINAEKCAHLFEKALQINADGFFICGPEEMTLEVKHFLEKNGVDEKKIHIELFTTGNNHPGPERETIHANEATKSSITVTLDGVSFNFELAYDDASILDAAAQQGADVPYSCKSGVCCTCRAKLLEGEVEMEVCYGLEPEEIAGGYILTCQSHPKSNRVVIDYDAK
ncbi:MAG TPA: 1,2-phenylacetyl-CoA epoxidase subunit PaaE [Chitinophagaceae bacterium]|nr:1,2-phenylacetyl-CoA epoxidase subunit PaaE [Chitinophagaceae bacterium]